MDVKELKNSGRDWEADFRRAWENAHSPEWRHPADAMRQFIMDLEDTLKAKADEE